MASIRPAAGAEAGEKPRRASPALLIGPALAGLLALALWWSTPRLGALAPYELVVVDAAAAGRITSRSGGAVARVDLAEGAGVSLELRPLQPSDEPVEVRAFLEGSSLKALDGESRALPDGALRLTLGAAALPREGRLRVLVGRLGTLPGNPVGTASHGRNWQRFDVAFSHAPPDNTSR